MTENFDMKYENGTAAAQYGGVTKEDWARQKREERDRAYAVIDDTADKAAHDLALFKSVLDVMARFEGLSSGNILLLTAQMPYATRLADYNTWHERAASIKKGEKGIVLLEPGEEYIRRDGNKARYINTRKVFDISQTDLNASYSDPDHFSPDQLLDAIAKTIKCNVYTTPERAPWINGKYDAEKDRIIISKDLDGEETFAALASAVTKMEVSKKHISVRAIELTGECAAYVLCRRFFREDSKIDILPDAEKLRTFDTKAMKSEMNVIRNLSRNISREIEAVLRGEKSRDDTAR